ncbi:Fatty-acid peroxygenase [Lentibacillus sp. JNUCC-1]|uniref:cytochrome P450 n=1 Tax=Lentibacillus sp. JNUCC-1 TaxID=2654513 RepID=UPI0012E84432|nr:cytochrome P450 [Lentibacillus sp. JNUCC-1]MUV36711.1 Fatty-acid peroxygenase [Lentibacillus sp. JNUCC-1]
MVYRVEMPVDHGADHTLGLLKEGYTYISTRREKFNSNIFATRVLGGQNAICMGGKEAAEVFYDTDKFKRSGAAPKRVQKTLFGEKGVQTLDGEPHRNRKKLFMDLMTEKRLAEMQSIVEKHWQEALTKWENKPSVHLYKEANILLTRAACEWAGVPLKESEVPKRAKQLNALFDAGGAVGLRHFEGRKARKDVEAWCAELIGAVRKGNLQAEEGRALHTIAWHKEPNGQYMPKAIAAVELVNILRPIVAVSVYIAFSALALHEYPAEATQLDDDTRIQWFVQEVRRFYPFFPVAAARVKKDFTWQGYVFKKDTLALLDLYGTNHDPDLWENPNDFKPERFKSWDKSPFDFIPQGGGDYYKNHRCPGEWLTIDIMKTSIKMLTREMSYTVPPQNLNYSMNRLPSLPKSGFLIKNVTAGKH